MQLGRKSGLRPGPGDAVRVVLSKWGEHRHWEYDAVLLGSDEHGDWIGITSGTRMTRPGKDYVAPTDQVCLVPAGGPGPRHWLATFHAIGGPVQVFVDMTTPPRWDGPVMRAVDLDLDVVRGLAGEVWVEDEDEFAIHQERYGYPEELIELARASRDQVLEALTHRHPPYNGAAQVWLDRLAARSGA